ncbi:MAG: dihydropteroate synthase [Mangrovicoccus sp.]
MPSHAQRDRFLQALNDGPLVMGILNVTPDSFSDGGRHNQLDQAVRHAQQMIADGADLLDIGGESTRPGAAMVEADEELARVLPVLEALQNCPVPISIDTYKASVARAAIGAGACIVNDVWGLQKDPAMADVIAETGAAAVLMHNKSELEPDCDILSQINEFFDKSLALAERAGIPAAHILLDPGIGFGKSYEQNLTCINAIPQLRARGYSVLLGLSRKRMFAQMLGAELDERLYGTLAANLAGYAKGASVFRVHDVQPHKEALKTLTVLENWDA